jgi:hypothetical protein
MWGIFGKKGAAIAALGAAVTLALAANAGAAIYNPSSLTFANQNVGTTSAAQQVNVGGGACGPDIFVPPNIIPGPCTKEATDIAVSGPFVITSNTCPAELSSPGATAISCAVGVAYKPTAAGPQSGFLRLTSSPSIVGVPLSGVGCTTVKVRVKGKIKKRQSCKAPTTKKKKKHKKK